MKVFAPFFCWLLPAYALFLSFSASTVRADDDPKTALKKAQAAQDAAPACRMTMTSTERDSQRTAVMTTEMVKPDSMHTRMEINGRVAMEMLTDGKKTFMRQGGGTELTEAPAHVSARLLSARKDFALDTLVEGGKDIQFLGHEDLDGKPASVYQFGTELMGVASTTKVWVSDADQRPLKAEADSHGEMKVGAGAGRKTNSHSVTTFEYDPSIKITLPGS